MIYMLQNVDNKKKRIVHHKGWLALIFIGTIGLEYFNCLILWMMLIHNNIYTTPGDLHNLIMIYLLFIGIPLILIAFLVWVIAKVVAKVKSAEARLESFTASPASCIHCGAQCSKNEKICPTCGAPN